MQQVKCTNIWFGKMFQITLFILLPHFFGVENMDGCSGYADMVADPPPPPPLELIFDRLFGYKGEVSVGADSHKSHKFSGIFRLLIVGSKHFVHALFHESARMSGHDRVNKR